MSATDGAAEAAADDDAADDAADSLAPSSEGWQHAGNYIGMYIRREIEGSDSKVTAKVVAYLPTTAADPYIVDGTPRELWRVKYMGSSALRGDTEDLEEHELESSEPSWSWAAYKHKDADEAADADDRGGQQPVQKKLIGKTGFSDWDTPHRS